jgi:hypothetical protein
MADGVLGETRARSAGRRALAWRTEPFDAGAHRRYLASSTRQDVSVLLRTALSIVLAIAFASHGEARAQSPTVTLLGYHTTAPASWAPRTPSSSMRLAEFVIPPLGDSSTAEVIVYFFGKGQGGTVASNLARWKAQFSSPDGKPVAEIVTHDSAGAFPVTFAEYRGTYARGIGAGSSPEQAKAGQALIAGIVETPRGTMFVQLFGAERRVAVERDAFMRFVTGMKE